MHESSGRSADTRLIMLENTILDEFSRGRGLNTIGTFFREGTRRKSQHCSANLAMHRRRKNRSKAGYSRSLSGGEMLLGSKIDRIHPLPKWCRAGKSKKKEMITDFLYNIAQISGVRFSLQKPFLY